MAIDYKPLLEGEDRSSESITDRGTQIVAELNTLDSENIREGGLHRDNFGPNTFLKQQFQDISTTTVTLVDKFPGEPGSSVVHPSYLDPAWDTAALAEGSQFSSTGIVGWTNLQSIGFTAEGGTNIDLKSDDSNGILVMTEQYLYTLGEKSGDTSNPTWAYIAFIVVAVDVVIETSSGGATVTNIVPLSKTVRYCDADVNNDTQAGVFYPHTDPEEGDAKPLLPAKGVLGGGRDSVQKNYVRKNMPIRAFITYKDVNQRPFAFGSTDKNSTATDAVKRIAGVRVYGAVKNCSYTVGGALSHIGILTPMAEFRDRVLDVLEINAKLATNLNRVSTTYP